MQHKFVMYRKDTYNAPPALTAAGRYLSVTGNLRSRVDELMTVVELDEQPQRPRPTSMNAFAQEPVERRQPAR